MVAKSFTPSVENNRNVRQRVTGLNTSTINTPAPSPFTSGTLREAAPVFVPVLSQSPFTNALQQQQEVQRQQEVAQQKQLEQWQQREQQREQQQATANSSMLDMMKQLLQSELGPLRHQVDRLNSRVRSMDTTGPVEEEEEEEEDEDAANVGNEPAFQLGQEGEKQEDGKPSRPSRTCKHDKGYHPYVRTG